MTKAVHGSLASVDNKLAFHSLVRPDSNIENPICTMLKNYALTSMNSVPYYG